MDSKVDALVNAMFDIKEGVALNVVKNNLEVALNTCTVKVWREDTTISLPTYGTEGDACCDVYAKSIEYDEEKDRYVVHTGLHFALPDDYEMELRPRSSNTKTEFYIPNSPCTLDWGYRGELLVVFKNRTNRNLINCLDYMGNAISYLAPKHDTPEYNNILWARQRYDKVNDKQPFPYKEGDRICQLLVRKREQIIWNEVDSLESLGTTERGEGGFGSTGK